MGNKNSRDQRLIADLQKRLTQLENIDYNSDNIVSKDEYATWTKDQENNLQLFKETVLKIRDAEHQVAIQRLQNEINTLRRINADLESRLTTTTPKTSVSTAATTNNKLFGELSRTYIDEEINKLLANVDVNVNIIPDYYERMIYRNIFNMFFGLIENLTNNSSIKFLNHTISFDIAADLRSRNIGNVKSTVDDVNTGEHMD